ncbi:MAG: hypothetical protein C0616_05525 [Desulfuromonas sp.]|nr:MAG: hypothetical protein C0616_05525 [Desulfuromonas sp.]
MGAWFNRKKLHLSGGDLKLPATLARELGSRQLTVVSHSRDHLLVAPGDGAGEVTLAGDLASFSVVDLLSFLNMTGQSGLLRCSLEGGEKGLHFEQGEVVAAESDIQEEGLAETLFRLGIIDRKLLREIVNAPPSRTPLGKQLVDKHLVAPKDLWRATRCRAEEIIYNLFTYQCGGFCFSRLTDPDPKLLRLNLNTRGLILEGLRRVDERSMILKQIGSLDVVVSLSTEGGEAETPGENGLLDLIRPHPLPVRELLRSAGVAEFDGLKQLHQLFSKKLIIFREPVEEEVVGDFGDLLRIFNGALRVLYIEVSKVNPDFGTEVRQFLAELPEPYCSVFQDAIWCADGSFGGGRIRENLSGLDASDQLRLLADAMNELLYMECLTARRDLGVERSTPLVERVQGISRRVKLILEKNDEAKSA